MRYHDADAFPDMCTPAVKQRDVPNTRWHMSENHLVDGLDRARSGERHCAGWTEECGRNPSGVNLAESVGAEPKDIFNPLPF
jgi:hypothetical protein